MKKQFETLQYTNPERTEICAIRRDGNIRIIGENTADLWEIAQSGALGPILAHVPPPKPTYQERLSEWRATQHCDMITLQYAIVDLGLFDDAEAIAATADPKWRIRWDARGGIDVRRMTTELLTFATELLKRAGIEDDPDEWLDALPVWRVPMPEADE